MDNFYKFYQEFCRFSVGGLLSSMECQVFLRQGGQDQPASQSSSRSFKNLIPTEVENH